MILPISWRLGAAGLALATAVTIIGLGYRHYEAKLTQISGLVEERARLQEDLAMERRSVSTLRDRVDEWEAAYNRATKAQAELAKARQAAGAEARRLNAILARHDLGALARAKPALVERRVNAGSDRLRRLLECVTAGAVCPGDDKGSPDERPAAADSPGADTAGELDPGHTESSPAG